MSWTWAKVHDMAPKAGSKTAKDKSAARSAGFMCPDTPGSSAPAATGAASASAATGSHLLARTQHTRAAAEQQTAQVQLFPCHLQGSCAHLHDLWSNREKWLPSAFKSTSGRCKASNVWGSCSGHSQCPHRCGRPWGLEHTVAKLWKR